MTGNRLSFQSENLPLPDSAPNGEGRQWIHICPAGKIRTRDGRGPYSLRSPKEVLARTLATIGDGRMVVDYEHQSVNTLENGKPAPAAGWVVSLEARQDGIWALVEWTAAAAAHIAAKEYRFISPVFLHRKDGEIVQIHNVALTNTPNLHGLTALSRAEVTAMHSDKSTALAELTRSLGLPENATEADASDKIAAMTAAFDLPANAPVGDLVARLRTVLAGLETIVPAGSPPPADPEPVKASVDVTKYVPLGDFERVVGELNRVRNGVELDAAKQHVEDQIRNGRMVPFLRDWAVSLCTINKPAYDAFIKKTGPALAPLFEASHTMRRFDGRREPGNELTDEEAKVCKTLGISAESFAKARGNN